MNIAKRMLILTAALSLCCCAFTSCGDKKEDAGEIKTQEKVVGEIVDESNRVKEETPKDGETEINISDTAVFTTVTINGAKIDFSNSLTMDNFTKKADLEENVSYKINDQNDDYIFKSGGYCKYVVDKDNIKNFGTTVFVEAVSMYNTEEYVDGVTESDYSPDECIVKGICADAQYVSDDFNIIFDNNVKIGDGRDVIEKKFGKGTVSKNDENRVIYKNTAGTLIINYKENKADRIIALVNEIEGYTPPEKELPAED